MSPSSHPSVFNELLLADPGLGRWLEPALAADVSARVQATGEPLLEILTLEHGLPRSQLLAVAAAAAGMEFAGTAPVPDPRFPAHLARKFACVGLAEAEDTGAWSVGFAHPVSRRLLEHLSLELEAPVRAVLLDPQSLPVEVPPELRIEEPALAGYPIRSGGPPRFGDGLSVEGPEAVLLRAARSGASDIHLECWSGRVSARCRVAGFMQPLALGTEADFAGLVLRLKAKAGMDTSAVRRPQDGRLILGQGREAMSFRVAVMPGAGGESMVLRVLQSAAACELPATAQLEAFASLNSGAVIIAGPTGSGKTTTLNALAARWVARDLKVLTVEDPVERVIEGAVQVAVDPGVELGFASALRAFLRHDPDAIAVGEIRDSETAVMAMQAALTGHLVLATLHVGGIAAIPRRLSDLGAEAFVVSAALAGMVAQRLLRRCCEACGGAGRMPGERHPCLHCAGSGCAGVVAVFESSLLSSGLREAIAAGADHGRLSALLARSGVVSLLGRARALCADGWVPPSEIERIFGREEAGA